MPTVHYIPKSLASTLTNEPITRIYACALTPGPTAANSPFLTNHWVLHCLFADAHRSIRIDPSASGAGNTLALIITLMPTASAADSVRTLQLNTSSSSSSSSSPSPSSTSSSTSAAAAGDLTFSTLTNLLTATQYNQYRFTATGQGCRNWIYSVVNVSNSQGCLSNQGNQVQELQTALKSVRVAEGQIANDEQLLED